MRSGYDILASEIFKILPHRKKISIDITSWDLDPIITKLSDLVQSYDCILMTQENLWHYSSSKKLKDFFVSNSDRDFFIQTIGYDYKKISHNAWEFSAPWIYDDFPSDLNYNLCKRNYSWSCLNNRQSYHRYLLGYYLDQKKLLPTMIYTQNILPGEDLVGWPKVLFESLPDYEKFLIKLPIVFKEAISDHRRDHTIDHLAFWDSYANIVTETDIQGITFDERNRAPTLTEKTWKPLLSGQIAVWLACPGHVSYLKQFGIETFEDLLPKNFDQSSIEEKCQIIVDLVARGGDFIEQYYWANQKKIDHNFRTIVSGELKKKMLRKVIDFLGI